MAGAVQARYHQMARLQYDEKISPWLIGWCCSRVFFLLFWCVTVWVAVEKGEIQEYGRNKQNRK